MKFYTDSERSRTHVDVENPNTWEKKPWRISAEYPDPLCSCVRYTDYLTPSMALWAYKDCTNCLGYGFMPIPYSELI